MLVFFLTDYDLATVFYESAMFIRYNRIVAQCMVIGDPCSKSDPSGLLLEVEKREKMSHLGSSPPPT